MPVADQLLSEFEQELATTRKFLERLPHDKLEWRPHPKSMTAGQLALHIAAAPGAVIELAMKDEVPVPDFSRPNPQPDRVDDVLGALERSAASVRKLLPTLGDDRMAVPWRAVQDGRTAYAVPRAAFLRSVLLNHWYHHRGQFGVYLRLLGARVPSSYGPSGDELPDWAR